ncbi:TIGR01777 family oxidoreductase [Bacillus sp. FJAT-49732]|uniref:TIGR01777 family oxidoreductase n=1 Tax=Lederbergia citrisecunda TaxID=2833583 RepID=A0A942TS08_9BACI|nr:TIGR01777 family oxidoreductase [Lederbergia citrisecunda]MBS4202268.1 TIGR01777 family oxidoreductase [Lederbergia citrisecunda]
MHIVIAGGSGFVGNALQERLLKDGHEITILTRNREKITESNLLRAVEWLNPNSKPEKHLKNVDAIVNIAGESLNGFRWTKAKKKRIVESRIRATREIVRIIGALDQMPKVLVNGSAVGYYGMSDEDTFTEESKTHANDFLASVVRKWEEETAQAEKFGIRTVYARLGVVLGKGGALPLMALPYKMGFGGRVGSGNQWVPWVHQDDVAGLFLFAIENESISGPLNVTAPNLVKNNEFSKMIGRVLHRPHWFPVPSIAMKVILGEMSEMLLRGQCVVPEKALQFGYTYQYPKLELALENILR